MVRIWHSDHLTGIPLCKLYDRWCLFNIRSLKITRYTLKDKVSKHYVFFEWHIFLATDNCDSNRWTLVVTCCAVMVKLGTSWYSSGEVLLPGMHRPITIDSLANCAGSNLLLKVNEFEWDVNARITLQIDCLWLKSHFCNFENVWSISWTDYSSGVSWWVRLIDAWFVSFIVGRWMCCVVNSCVFCLVMVVLALAMMTLR